MPPVFRIVDRQVAKTLVIIQAFMIPIAALIAGLIQDSTAALSAGLGALVYWLATCFFAWQTFKQSGARASEHIVGGMYKGLAGKFAIVTVGLVAIFMWVKPISMLAVIGGFLLVQMVSWLMPLVLLKRRTKTSP